MLFLVTVQYKKHTRLHVLQRMSYKMLKLLLLLCVPVFANRPYCDKKSVSQLMQVPTYDFSVNLLDRISQETGGHFVFSPISTWLQLLTLADGAKGITQREILKVTNYHKIMCLRAFVKEVFNSLYKELHVNMKHSIIIVIDNFLNVKQSFVNNVEGLNDAKILSVDFNPTNESADKVNEIIKTITNGVISESLDSDDFIKSVLLMIDAASLKVNWRTPFNPVYTKPEAFYSYEKVLIGEVNMMHQTGYFKVGDITTLNAKSLEMPFNDRLTMIFLLPTNGTAADMFWVMKRIRLPTLFKLLNSNGSKLVNVKLPRFELTTDIDNMPELLYDMGLKRLFMPSVADLRKISDHKVYLSMMSNKADIEVTEAGVSGSAGPDFLVAPEKPIDVIFNRPFVYLIADKITNVIIFAGIYSEPSLY